MADPRRNLSLGRLVPRLGRGSWARWLLTLKIDALARLLLLPFRRRWPVRQVESPELEARTDELNRAAEAYWARLEDPGHAAGKPFTERLELPQRLFDLGVLLHWLRAAPGDTVLDLGAGSCWLSRFLNRYGCRTVSVDVSPTALAIGRQAFEEDPGIDWGLEPEFLVYDGRRLPLEDGSVDRVALVDAFHHLPNPRQVLSEMHRVLRPGGLVAMVEPGPGHAGADTSRWEVATTGILENEFDPAAVARIARDVGFQRATVVPTTLTGQVEVAAERLAAFTGGRGFSEYWWNLTAGLEGEVYLLLYKGDFVASTRAPGNLAAEIGVSPPPPWRVRAGEQLDLAVRAFNRSDTRWLAAADAPGWTRLGAHLYRRQDGGDSLIDFDFHRQQLAADVEPFTAVELAVRLPAVAEPGDYVVELDFVIEGTAWFAQLGSEVLRGRLVVEQGPVRRRR